MIAFPEPSRHPGRRPRTTCQRRDGSAPSQTSLFYNLPTEPPWDGAVLDTRPPCRIPPSAGFARMASRRMDNAEGRSQAPPSRFQRWKCELQQRKRPAKAKAPLRLAEQDPHRHGERIALHWQAAGRQPGGPPTFLLIPGTYPPAAPDTGSRPPGGGLSSSASARPVRSKSLRGSARIS